MDELKVLRPWSEHGAYHWVHIDADRKPLCGVELNKFVTEFHLEIWDGKTDVCGACRAVENQYDVHTLQAGQMRKYGPSEYIYDVTDLADEKRTRADVLAFCQAHVKKSYLKEDMSSPFGPRMAGMTERVGEPGKWRYHVFCESTH